MWNQMTCSLLSIACLWREIVVPFEEELTELAHVNRAVLIGVSLTKDSPQMLLCATEVSGHVERYLDCRLLACSEHCSDDKPHAEHKARNHHQHHPEPRDLNQCNGKKVLVHVVVMALVVQLERLDYERNGQAPEHTVRQAVRGGAGGWE